MSDSLTQRRRYIGTTFENFICDSLGYFDEVYSETEITEKFDKITKIDIMARLDIYCFLIQCKYRKDPIDTDAVDAFKYQCNNLIKELNKNYKFIPIYLTRIKNTPRGELDDGENIYLYEKKTELDGFTIEKNIKDYYNLLMKLHHYIFNITSKTNIYPTLKEWDSLDVLMAF